MVERLVSVDVFPVVTEETTVWKWKTVVGADDGRTWTLTPGFDEGFETEDDAMRAALGAVRGLESSRAGVLIGAPPA